MLARVMITCRDLRKQGGGREGLEGIATEEEYQTVLITETQQELKFLQKYLSYLSVGACILFLMLH